MKAGKISESMLKRSVFRQLNSVNDKVKNGAGVGADCAVFSCGGTFCAVSTYSEALLRPENIRYAVLKAAGGVACCGAQPFMATLSLLLSPYDEEADLQYLVREADRVAEELHIQIAGGHTAVTNAALVSSVTVNVVGETDSPILSGGARPGQDVVVSKWIGMEGTARLAVKFEDRLKERYPFHMIEQAAGLKQYLSILPEAATAAKSNVSAMHDVSGGGIFAALWELAESAGVGLSIDLKKIPVKQETVEICEFFGINPYELLSGGCLLMTADDGENLVRVLEAEGIPAVVAGRVTEGNDRVVINEEEKRFLERPKTDEITKIL